MVVEIHSGPFYFWYFHLHYKVPRKWSKTLCPSGSNTYQQCYMFYLYTCGELTDMRHPVSDTEIKI